MISVIIPVYNVENYLHVCLESLIAQTVKDFEIILINDGSTDNSLAICNEYSNRLQNCKVINKLNSGVSDSRNLGIDIATGEFIYFMDSDDFVTSDFIRILKSQSTENECIVFRYNKVNRFGKIKKTSNKYLFKHLNSTNDLFQLFSNIQSGNCLTVWNKIIKRSFLLQNNIRFRLFKNAEDFIFSLDIYLNTKKILFIDDILYNYRVVPTSHKHSENYNLLKNQFVSLSKLDELLSRDISNIKNIECVKNLILIWFGYVTPLNTTNFKYFDFKTKKLYLNQIFENKLLSKYLCEFKYSNSIFLNYLLFTLRFNSSFLLLLNGFIFKYFRKYILF